MLSIKQLLNETSIFKNTFLTKAPGNHSSQVIAKKRAPVTLQRISSKLAKNTLDDIPIEHRNILKRYTGFSHNLNTKLINNVPLDKDESEIHDAILKHSKPLDLETHLYSGVSNALGEQIKNNQTSIFYSPAHLSFTHDKDMALFHCNRTYSHKFNDLHIFHVHTKPSDKGIHVEPISTFPGEYETILPSGTSLKHLGTSTYIKGYKPNRKHIYVHHFEIEHQK